MTQDVIRKDLPFMILY